MMPLRICEDVGTTRRKSMTPTRALRIWEQHKGKCVLCGLRIDGEKSDWFVEHLVALELGGPDTDANCGPAHLYHKAEKDAADHSAAAKAKRRKRAALGITAPKRPIQSAGFAPAAKQHRATGALSKPSLPRRPLYASQEGSRP